MKISDKIRAVIRRFAVDTVGVAMTEAIVMVPLLFLLAVGVLEFGMLFWQREQIETGLRDASRYIARCRHAQATCEQNARNLAYYGSTAASATHRVPNWDAAGSTITFSQNAGSVMTTVSATTTHQLANAPMFGVLGLGQITVSAYHRQRVIGW